MNKILFLDHSPVVGGSQLATLNYVRNISKDEFSVVVACSNSSPLVVKGYKKYASKVYILDFGRLKPLTVTSMLSFIKTLKELIRIIRNENPDIICATTERTVYLGSIAGFILRKKVVWIIRDYFYSKILLNFISFIPEGIAFVSKSLLNHYDLRRPSVVINVGSSIKEKLKKLSREDVRDFKGKYGLVGKFVISYIGRLTYGKGIHVLLNTAKKMKRSNIAFLIVGEKSLGDKMYKEDLKPTENVVFTGFINNVELALKSSDVFIHPCIEREAYATTIVESMVAKVPVIASDVGGNPELVKNNVTGLLIKANDQEDLEESILKLYNNRKLGKELARKAYKLVCKRASLKFELFNVENLFKSL